MSNKKSSDKYDFTKFSGFYKLTSIERLKKIQVFIPELTDDDIQLLLTTGSLELEIVNRMIENAVGTISIPFGLAVNFLINRSI